MVICTFYLFLVEAKRIGDSDQFASSLNSPVIELKGVIVTGEDPFNFRGESCSSVSDVDTAGIVEVGDVNLRRLRPMEELHVVEDD